MMMYLTLTILTPYRKLNSNEETFQGHELPEIYEIGKMDDERQASDVYGKYLGAELQLPGNGDQMQIIRVVKRIKDNNVNAKPVLYSTLHEPKSYNPLLDTSEYLVKFGDGSTKELTANIIAESMFAQIDEEGHHFQLLKEISEHRRLDNAVSKADGFYTNSLNGPKIPKRTTRGWELLVHWIDGSSDWIKLKDLKVSNPVELAEYAKAQGIDKELAFNWWVPLTLHKRDRIIQKVKSKYLRTTHIFGIRVPKNVDDALR